MDIFQTGGANDEQFIDFERFVQINCLIYYFSSSREEQIDFFTRCLNPKGAQTIRGKDLDKKLNVIFGNQFVSGETAESVSHESEAEEPLENLKTNENNYEVDSMIEKAHLIKGTVGFATDVKRIFIKTGCVSDKDIFHPNLFKELLSTGQIDIEIFQRAF